MHQIFFKTVLKKGKISNSLKLTIVEGLHDLSQDDITEGLQDISHLEKAYEGQQMTLRNIMSRRP